MSDKLKFVAVVAADKLEFVGHALILTFSTVIMPKAQRTRIVKI